MPEPTMLMVSVHGTAAKLAVTDSLPLTTRVCGLAVPVRLPLKFAKV